MGNEQSNSLYKSEGSASRTQNWTYKLHFTPDASNPGASPVYISNNELIAYFNNVDGAQDKLVKVWTYEYRIKGVQANPINGVDHHFVVVKSQNWFWTFEKDSEGICVQRSKEKKSVLQEYRGKVREPRTLNPARVHTHDSKQYRIKDIISWIYRKGKVNEGYHLMERNCQIFAMELFEGINRRGLR